MSLVSDPQAKYAYVLESDREKSTENQPVFFFKLWTVRYYRNQLATITKFEDSTDNDEVFGAAISLINDGLLDWSNVKGPTGNVLPFDPEDKEAIQDVVSTHEMMELAYAVINQKPSAEDKKKLSSPSTSPTACAEPVPAEDQPAATENPTQ